MIDYIIVFSLLILFALVNESIKSKRLSTLFFILISFLLIIFSGLRYYTGWDFEVYQQFYNAIYFSIDPLITINSTLYRNFDVGFRLFSLSAIYSSWLPVLLISVISVGTSFLLVSKSDKRIFGIFVLFYFWYEYFSVFSIQRQVLAHGLIVLGVFILLNNSSNKKYIIYFLLSIISITIHSSALIASVLYIIAFVLSNKKIEVNRVLFYSIICFSIFMLISNVNVSEVTYDILKPVFLMIGGYGKVLEGKMQYYFLYLKPFKVGLSFRYIEYLTVLIISYLFFDRIKSQLKNNYSLKLFYLSFYMSLFHVLFSGLLSSVGIIQERVECYFYLTHVILLSFLIFLVPKKLIYYLLFVVFASVFVGVKYDRLLNSDAYLGADSHYQRFIPYKSILD
ncbi:EpsG family protein [Photobacterium kishitanii]|uniref:EpsG family protein n=1 Tax=Photobacterium kishitanii TaxID=318456 RepID=UPI00071AEC05|nr:EpsG family protein [Photobacterium kishitanii]